MQKVQLELYPFDELSSEAKEYAIQKWQDEKHMLDWEYDFRSQDLLEEFSDTLKSEGIFITPVKDIHYEGFYRRGYGLSFDGIIDDIKAIEAYFEKNPNKNTEIQDLLQYIKDIDKDENIFCIEKKSCSYHYSHEKTRYVDISDGLTDKYRDLLDDIRNFLEEIRIDHCIDFYNQLEKLYAYCSSKEAIKDYLSDNDNQYFIDGVLYIY